jgi:hypothetical protein
MHVRGSIRTVQLIWTSRKTVVFCYSFIINWFIKYIISKKLAVFYLELLS